MDLAVGVLYAMVPLFALVWILRVLGTVLDGLRAINRHLLSVVAALERIERRQEDRGAD